MKSGPFGRWLQLFIRPQDRSYSRSDLNAWYNMPPPDKRDSYLGRGSRYSSFVVNFIIYQRDEMKLIENIM